MSYTFFKKNVFNLDLKYILSYITTVHTGFSALQVCCGNKEDIFKALVKFRKKYLVLQISGGSKQYLANQTHQAF